MPTPPLPGSGGAHGRYVARESATHEGDSMAVGFGGRGESIDIMARLESWEKNAIRIGGGSPLQHGTPVCRYGASGNRRGRPFAMLNRWTAWSKSNSIPTTCWKLSIHGAAGELTVFVALARVSVGSTPSTTEFGEHRRRAFLRAYLETRKESTIWPVSETCFRRKVFPSTSITLSEWTCEMNLSVKGCQLAGSVCCSGL
jgi:hypothetical protein